MDAGAQDEQRVDGGASLAISIVTFNPDLAKLTANLISLSAAIARARRDGLLRSVTVWLIDNSTDPATVESIRSLAQRALGQGEVQLELRHGQGNLGYGRAHNLALLEETSNFHLVLNPDVELKEDALSEALAFMRTRGDVGLLAPAVFDERGQRQYLCKRFPAAFDLLLRAFAPAFIKRLFARRLAHYEMRDVIGDGRIAERVPIASGAFMFVRRSAVERTQGFDPQFFLYFEDFDWSLRLGAVAMNIYAPSVQIVHHGGGAAKKGFAHLRMFAESAWRFYRKHGFKWW
jgi:hypothetical protein